MHSGKSISIIHVTLAALLTLLMTVLVRSASAVLQGTNGTPDTPSGLVFDPISFLIGAGVGGLAVGIPLLLSRHTKSGHVTLLKRTAEIEEGVRVSTTKPAATELPEGTQSSNPIPGVGIVVKSNPRPPKTK